MTFARKNNAMTRTLPAPRSLVLALGLAGVTAIGAGLARADENAASTFRRPAPMQ